MKKQILTIATLLAVMTGCNKHIAGISNRLNSGGNNTTFKSELPKSRKANYDILFKDTHGVLSFNVSRQGNYQQHGDWSASGVFCPNYWASYTMQSRVYKDVGTVRIGEKIIPKESRNGYLIRGHEPVVDSFESFFGNVIAFEIPGTTESGYMPQTCSLYIPKKLLLSFSGYINTPNRPSVKRNTRLTMHWQADSANSKGVLIQVENEHPVDSMLYPDMNSNTNYGTNYILAEDDGSYTFGPEDFANLPDNHELLIVVYRGNVAIEDNGHRKVKFYGAERIYCPQFCLMK
jgi:hypothetical protein